MAIVWELMLTTGLVSVILGTASGAQQVGSLSALGAGSFIALAGLVGAPVSGASMNRPARWGRRWWRGTGPPGGSTWSARPR